jgi:hypothetical protein
LALVRTRGRHAFAACSRHAIAEDLDRATDSQWDWVAEQTRTYLASGGTDQDPTWFMNLAADPSVGLQAGTRRFTAHAPVPSPAESCWNQAHLLHALREYERHHNGHRPHRGNSRDEDVRILRAFFGRVSPQMRSTYDSSNTGFSRPLCSAAAVAPRVSPVPRTTTPAYQRVGQLATKSAISCISARRTMETATTDTNQSRPGGPFRRPDGAKANRKSGEVRQPKMWTRAPATPPSWSARPAVDEDLDPVSHEHSDASYLE